MRGVHFCLWAPSSLLLQRNFETGIGHLADWSFAIDCDQRLIHQTATPDRSVPLARMAREANHCSSRCGVDSSMNRVVCLSSSVVPKPNKIDAISADSRQKVGQTGLASQQPAVMCAA